MIIDLKPAIVRILSPNGTTAGTGFAVTDDGLIATCAHVVQGTGAGPGDNVRVVFHATGEEREAQVEPAWWRGSDAEDVAILCLDGPSPEGVTSLSLGSSAGVEGHTLSTFGFPDAKPVEGMGGKCEVVGRTTERGFPVLQLRSSEVTPGFSGTPVLDTVTRRVVGVVTAITIPDQYGRLPETAFITPTETLRAVCPELQLSDLCPYRGLAAFIEDHAEFFFGREKQFTILQDSLRKLSFSMSRRDCSKFGKRSGWTLYSPGVIAAGSTQGRIKRRRIFRVPPGRMYSHSTPISPFIEQSQPHQLLDSHVFSW